MLPAAITQDPAGVRKFYIDDIPQVVPLNGRVFGTKTARTPATCFDIHYLRPGSVSETVPIAARGGAFDRVLQRTAVRRRLDPRFPQDLTDHQCLLRCELSGTLCQTRNQHILPAIREGKPFLSRLEGESWMRLLDE